MKNIIIFSTVVIFALLALVWVGFSEFSDRNRVQQSEIDGLREQLKNCK